MSSYYKCTHFDIRELVDKNMYDEWGESAWMFMRTDALVSLDNIRDYFGKPVIVNDWMFGGSFQYRGFRTPWCAIGASISQHRLGNAFDLDVKGMGADEVRQVIISMKDHPAFERITCMETGTAYIHFDCRNIPDRIRLITV